MKKYIHVTILEFLEKGGKLEVGREIWSKTASNAMVVNSEFLRVDDKMTGTISATATISDHNENTLLLAKNDRWKSFPISPSVFYVQIEVTPIWK